MTASGLERQGSAAEVLKRRGDGGIFGPGCGAIVSRPSASPCLPGACGMKRERLISSARSVKSHAAEKALRLPTKFSSCAA